ncbi:hypothetical protein ACVWY3_006852 [Bradyrhizobium sp. USDA 4486]
MMDKKSVYRAHDLASEIAQQNARMREIIARASYPSRTHSLVAGPKSHSRLRNRKSKAALVESSFHPNEQRPHQRWHAAWRGRLRSGRGLVIARRLPDFTPTLLKTISLERGTHFGVS